MPSAAPAARAVMAALPLAALAGTTGSVLAQDARPVQVLVVPPECEGHGVDLDETVRLMRIELRGDSVEHVEVVVAPLTEEEQPGRIAAIHLRIDPCAADTTAVEAIVEDAVTRKRVRRTLELGGLPRGVRPRALALGIAELLRASWAELARVDPLEPAVPVSEATRRWLVAQARVGLPTPASERSTDLALPQPAPAAPPPAVPPDPSIRVALAAALRAFPADGTALFGARAGLSLPLLAALPLRVRIDASYERGLVRVTLGDVRVGLAAAALALDASTDPTQPFVLELGPRIEVGYGWAEGTPDDPTDRGLDGGRLVAFSSGHALLAGRFSDRWAAFLDLEIGHTVVGLDATVDGRSTTGIAGPTIAAQLGLRWAP